MKRISYFLMLFALMFSLGMQAKQTLVKNATELKSVFPAAQDADTILLAPGVYNVSNSLFFPPTGIITLMSKYTNIPDSIATLQMNMQGSTIAAGVKAGLIFEYLKLQHNNPTATSGHIIYINKKFGNIAKLVFRHCDISNGVRGLFRSVKPDNTTDVTYTSCGDLDYLEMTNCLVHNTFVTSGNAWPLLYLGHLPLEVNISNNTFYDLAYMKNIFTMSYADPNSGRNAKINFKNNTVCTSVSNNYIATSNYLGEETEFNIENNVFLMPNWTNTLNVANGVLPAIVSCKGGLITAKNNLVEGPKAWIKGQTLDAEGLGGFVLIDTTNTYTMANLEQAWTDFADPVNGDYSFLSGKKLATYGVGGTPIGDTRWLKNFTTPRTLSVSFTPETITPTITPTRGFYENGTAVKVTSSAVDGYTFKGWKDLATGNVVSMDNPYTVTLSSDLNLQAQYIVLQPRAVAVTVSGSTSATYTITPAKTIYYEGDAITIALNKHFINEFTGWSDGNTDMTRNITIAGDINLTANFTEHPYILAWDFHQLTTNNSTFAKLESNHAKDAANKGYMIYMSADTVAKIETRNNKFTTVGKELYNCLTRKTPIENTSKPSYVYIKFSTKGLSNLRVKSIYATDNSFFKVQKMDYSVNGGAYTTFATDTVSGNIDQIWRPFSAKLPVAAENQDSIAIRWVADPTTEQLFATGVTSYALEQIYITNIIVIDNNFTALNDVNAGNNCKIYSVNNRLIIVAENAGRAEIYTLMGQKVRDAQLSEGQNELTGFNTGVYLVKTGSKVQKILMK